MAVVLVGAALRLMSLAIHVRLPLEPDATGTLALAAAFDVRDPWAASLREPGWIGVVAAWSEIFGYTPLALRALTVLLSVALLISAALLFHRHLAPGWALAATAVVSGHGLLVLSAGRGLREELVGILTILAVRGVVERQTLRAPALAVTAAVGTVAVVRWEIALLAVALLLLGTVLRRVPARFVAGATLVAIATSGPWLVANDREYGSWQASSNHAADFWYRADVLGPTGVTSAPSRGGDQLLDSEMTWSRYYLEVVGPAETIARTGLGTAGLLHDLGATALWPLNDRWLEQNVSSGAVRQAGWALGVVSDVFGWLLLAAVVVGVTRSRRARELGVVSLLLVVFGCAAYAPLRSLPFFEARFIEFTIPFASVVAVWGFAGLAGRRRSGAFRRWPAPEPQLVESRE